MTHRAHRDQAPDTGVTYVFAVCRGTRATRTADVTGLVGMPGGAAVRLLPSGPLTAVVQTVPAADFTDEVWQSRLSDPREIERYARAHHEVVSAAAAHGPAVPLPLATLYHDDDRARRALDDEAPRFHRVLKRIARHAEWGVKVYEPATAPEEAQPVTVGGGGLEAPAAGAGLAYLNRRRGVQERREQRRERALSVAESVDAELRELAAASRRLRTHGAVPGGDGRVHVLNATYLVAEHRSEELDALVRGLGERTGALIELTGPWVPYSFVGEV
ncbi:GvpL/GvpF family gas vesicle protein [Streptomyces anulatus]|uniref:GvpL/GvpF family gas vesicle protein n=1 Tax=Streptomyces TaxID=1883 RepID=UPI001B3657E0|nr:MULTISPECIES: GvpL/GvpF family gas vesicle protein [unclassified Streptomyces]MBQ1109224.1 GvpL/GvpF family gas vesicle protein [Streptomyces sp. 404i]MBQ1115502.1 GvpL/GvpF family gas vesicle protein [Streptomyces sp. C3-3]